MKIPKIKVPFNKNGQMIEMISCRQHILKDNCIFEAELKISNYARKRSLTKLIFVDCENNIKYYMFMQEFIDIVDKIEKGRIRGKFCFVIRNSSYGIKFLE